MIRLVQRMIQWWRCRHPERAVAEERTERAEERSE